MPYYLCKLKWPLSIPSSPLVTRNVQQVRIMTISGEMSGVYKEAMGRMQRYRDNKSHSIKVFANIML